MGITAYHVFTSPVADGTNTQLVRPSNWNSSHALTLNAVGSEISNAFGNGGGVSFGYDGTNITASAPGGGNDGYNSAQFTNSTANSTMPIVWAGNSNGSGNLTMGLTGSTVTASFSNPSIAGLISAINVSAGTTSGNVSAITFSNSNGVSFGLNGGVITGSHNGLTTARASNDAIGLNTALTAGPLAWTVNSSGLSLNASNAAGTTSGFGGNLISGSMTHNTAGLNLSLNHPAWLTTARASNDAIGLNSAFTAGPLLMTINSAGLSLNAGSAAGTTSGFGGNLISGSMTHNTAGLNLSLNHPAWLTTARASNDAIGLNSAQSNVTWTLNSAGLSLDARGYAGTGTSATNASITLNSNGLAISVAAPGGGGAINVSAGTTSGNLQTLQFDNGNGVTFGLNGSTVTASVAAGGGVAIADGGGTQTSGTVQFSNSNNITFGLNNGTMTASYQNPYEIVFWRPNDMVTTVGAPIVNSASIVYCPMDHNLTATRFDYIASVNVATAGNNSSAGFLYSATAVLYTRNGGTLSSLSSATTANQMTWSSNATGSVTGAFFLSIPLNVNAQADKYWVGAQISTRATGLTGANTTSLGNTVSMMGVGSVVAGAFSVREPGAATANSNGWVYGMGMYSGTSNFSTIAFSNLTQQGTNAQRANIGFRMVNV